MQGPADKQGIDDSIQVQSEHMGMPIYLDATRELMDVTAEESQQHNWHPANTAAEKLFRCIECLRDIEGLLESGGRLKNKTKQRRFQKILLTPLHSLASGTRDLLNDLETNPETTKKLSPEVRLKIREIRERFLTNVGIDKGGLLSLTRNKLSAHIDKDIRPETAKSLLETTKPSQVGLWIHSCVTVLSDAIKLPGYYWSCESGRADWIRMMFTEPFLSTLAARQKSPCGLERMEEGRSR